MVSFFVFFFFPESNDKGLWKLPGHKLDEGILNCDEYGNPVI